MDGRTEGTEYRNGVPLASYSLTWAIFEQSFKSKSPVIDGSPHFVTGWGSAGDCFEVSFSASFLMQLGLSSLLRGTP